MYVIEKKDGYIISIGTAQTGEKISKELFDGNVWEPGVYGWQEAD